MGVANAENSDAPAEMTTAKPRERQFQVVPVPGKFTRGRWQCWDYRDEKPDVSGEILDFTEKADKNVPPSTLPVAVDPQPMANLGSLQQSGDALSHTSSEPVLPLVQGNAVSAQTAAQVPVDIPISTQSQPVHKESSTIVVTSIAPAPVTPVHGTPSSSADIIPSVDVAANLTNVQVVPSSVTIMSESESEGMLSPPLTLSSAGATLSSSASIPIGAISSQDGSDLPCSTSPSVPAVPANSFVNPPIISTTPVPAPLPRQSSAQGAAVAALSRQTSLASFPEGAPPIISTLPPIDGALEEVSAAGNVPGGPNVVAIDNKIEQAMDLVKTHLTFAVREEVEILRSTIVDLEAKVAQLESQNQVLKQFAPAEVVANLALLVQNAQQQKQLQQQLQQAQAASVSLPTNAQPTLAPPAQPVIVTTQPIHAAQMQQQPVGAVPVLTTATTLPPSVDATPIVIPNSISSAGDTLITNSASQSMSTLNSMAVNVSSSTSNTATL
uniref:TSC22 domain family protein 1 n=1 Tax=Ascaris suum TaxID=6253 RepID=F1L223_ASCSU